jgi:hypothetical protein
MITHENTHTQKNAKAGCTKNAKKKKRTVRSTEELKLGSTRLERT